MASSRKVVKVFLASPNDLARERRIAKSVVDEVNGLWGEKLGYHVELVGWEDTVSRFGRPQALINAELEQCEYFIGLMYKRWGTAPSTGTTYSSGFEEEFDLAFRSRSVSNRPEISLFFKKVPDDALADPGDDLKKVIAFREKIIAEKTILFEAFEDETDFESRVRRCISNYIQSLHTSDIGEEKREIQTSPVETGSANAISSPPSGVLPQQSITFLQDFIAGCHSLAFPETLSPFLVARFRLISQIISAEGNDLGLLGPHDSNLLYLVREKADFGDTELGGLVESGLNNFINENTPLWYWIKASSSFLSNGLSTHTLFGDVQKRRGAFLAMRLVREQLKTGGVARESYLKSWFANDEEGSLKAAALNYLAVCGIEGDLPTITEELNKGDYNTRSAAVEAIVRINLRIDRTKAFTALLELQPDAIPKDLVEDLFEDVERISTEILERGASHRSTEFRRSSVMALRARNKLATDLAERLLGDPDAFIRFDALQSLTRSGRVYSNGDAKVILVKPAAGLGLYGNTDQPGESCFEKFREQSLGLLPSPALQEIVENASIYDDVPFFAMVKSRFSIIGDDLRKAITDQFESYLEERLAKMSSTYGPDSKLVKDTRGLKNFLRKSLLRKALDIICEKSFPTDLDLVRNNLRSGFVDSYSANDVAYLQKFGEWSDISLIKEMINKPNLGQSLLSSIGDKDRYAVAAKAVYQLGKERLQELLSITHGPLLANLIVLIPNRVFKLLEDDVIFSLFDSEDPMVRKVTALKAVRSLPKTRVEALLTRYTEQPGRRYYNVIHWLDFGLSSPPSRRAFSVDDELRRMT